MAIEKLTMERDSEVNRSGNTLSYSQEWYYKVDVFTSSVGAENLIQNLTASNPYGWLPIGEPHPDNEALVPVNYKVKRQNKQTTQYTITVQFSNDRETINNSTSPLQAPANVSYDQIDRQVTVTKDPVTGNALQNPAGQPIWPPLTENKPDSRITYVKNRSKFDNKGAQEFRNVVNDAPVYIDGKQYDAGTVKLERWTGSRQFDSSGDIYYPNTYQLLIREEGWKRKLVALGFQDKDGNVPNLEGRLLTEPWKIQEDGTFFSKADQEDPEKFYEFEVNTLEKKNYNFISFR